jgi:chitin disaccharide deacetylase
MSRGVVLNSRVPSRFSSPVRLVVNADGFGASAARDRAVLATHQNGIVTSTSVLGNAADPSGVKQALAAAPNLGVGVLLALVDGAPVAAPETVPSLVGPDGKFPPRARDAVLAWAKAALAADEVELELDAQVSRLRDLGLTLDHLSSKDGLGCLPVVAQAQEKVARRHGIPGLRTAVEKPTLAWAAEPRRGMETAAMAAMAWFSRRDLGARRHGPQSWGFFESGRLDEVRILEILGRLGPGSHELLCHPDLDSDAAIAPRNSEAFALTSTRVRAVLAERQIELCRWADLF